MGSIVRGTSGEAASSSRHGGALHAAGQICLHPTKPSTKQRDTFVWCLPVIPKDFFDCPQQRWDTAVVAARMATLAISRSRIILLCVGCCSFVMVATLRLQFLLNQTFGSGEEMMLWRADLHGATDAANANDRRRHQEAAPLATRSPDLRKDAPAKEEVPARMAADPRQHQQVIVKGTNHTLHFPNYFTQEVPFESLLSRDNLLSVFTGCSIASWTYSGVTFHKAKVRFYDDCKCFNEERNLTGRDITSDTAASLLQSGDTLYVELKKISHFVKQTLPKIQVDVVLLSGQNHLVPQKPQKLDYVWSQEDFDAIVNNPHITHWFLMNMDIYAQDPDHEKVSGASSSVVSCSAGLFSP